jgi:hypothetical protein
VNGYTFSYPNDDPLGGLGKKALVRWTYSSYPEMRFLSDDSSNVTPETLKRRKLMRAGAEIVHHQLSVCAETAKIPHQTKKSPK